MKLKKFLAGGLTVAVGVLAVVPAASASPHHPKGEFAPFGDCPLSQVNLSDCVVSTVKGGSITIGAKTVPIKNPVTLQAGFEGGGETVKVYGAEDGKTLSETPQPVPGGLLGITAPTWWPLWVQVWFNNGISEGFTGVDATLELTGPTKGLTKLFLSTEHLFSRKGTTLGIPARVHLENFLLGPECYIGTETHPMQINLTTGTTAPPAPNKPISGSRGTSTFNEEFTLINVAGAKLVDNSFAAPEATGCGGIFSLFVNPLVNAILGTPAAGGTNTAILESNLLDGSAFAVRASE
jgi:hypothetical protein